MIVSPASEEHPGSRLLAPDPVVLLQISGHLLDPDIVGGASSLSMNLDPGKSGGLPSALAPAPAQPVPVCSAAKFGELLRQHSGFEADFSAFSPVQPFCVV